MKTYMSQIPVSLHSGKVLLGERDYRIRAHNLKPCAEVPAKGEWEEGELLECEIVNAIQFKANQEFIYSGEIPKSMASLVSVVGEEPEVPEPTGEEDDGGEEDDDKSESELALDWLKELHADGLLDHEAEESKVYLTANGVIDARVLGEHLGTKVNAAWRDGVWKQYLAWLESEGEGEE